MHKFNRLVVCSSLVLASASPVLSADFNGAPGTVNYFTAQQRAQAFRAATQAGYSPQGVEAFQDGNFFLTATKGGRTYEVTVLPTGKIEVSTPVPPLKGGAA